MEIVRPVKRIVHRLKMYVYDVYRFMDAKIMVEKMEKNIFHDIESVKKELEEFSRTRSETMDKVNEATTPTQLEQKLTEFEVTLSTDTSEEIEQIRQDMDKLNSRMNKTDPPEYHTEIVQEMEGALDALENDIQRNVSILNSVIERLDKQANPLEMAEQIRDFKTNQETGDLREVQKYVDGAETVFKENSLQKLAGWKKMLSTHVYRKEQRESGQKDFNDDSNEEMDNEFGDEPDLDFEEEDFSESDEGLNTDFDEEF